MSDRAQAVAPAVACDAYAVERGGEGYFERAYGVRYER